ncbi:unnamed protein product [Meloidogyne enterolobii]|uniref:Uncharacterized protein n=1 Tax=Meloidogyne enterolobii TaxID=390850 RepID=A0ACB0ZUE9_MELEN
MEKLLIILFYLLFIYYYVQASISNINYRPKGNNPLLYEPGTDPIIHLDADTFVDTVLRPDKEKAYLVEFYKDWCGYCRRFMPWYKVLAGAVKTWPFVQVAAINCADAYNVKICRANDIPTVPKLKYFSRNATSFADGQVIEHSYNSAIEMRQRLHAKLLDEFDKEMEKGNSNYYLGELQYERRCKFAKLCSTSLPAPPKSVYAPTFSYAVNTQMQDPWEGVSNGTKFLVYIFERNPEKGLPFSLDLLLFKPQVEVRRVLVWGPNDVRLMVEQKNKKNGDEQLPYVVVLERGGKTEPLMAESITDSTLPKLHELINPLMEQINQTEQAEAHAKKPIHVLDCAKNPERCKQLFYVSESDMLKAIHAALLDEVISSGGNELDSQRISNLKKFLDLLIQRFPRKTFERSLPPTHPKSLSVGKPLSWSLKAIQVFNRMRQFLDKNEIITMDDWKNEFDAAKAENSEPFPIQAEWEHCKGSKPIFRGFTCGLWTAFHAMTVQAYLNNEQESLKPLKAIQAWVSSFFSCSGCRRHFMSMTTEKFPMDERNVKTREDIVGYLWKAHNTVNARLHGDEATEDPQFPKEQFPPSFLCPECRDSKGELDQERTLDFLLQFSTNIKPRQ